MSPTPVTFTSPITPAACSWEAIDEEVATRYGMAYERVVRFAAAENNAGDPL